MDKEKDPQGQYRALAEKLREKGLDQGDEPRVKGKGKGKEIVVRYNGEVIEGEHEAVIRDPRKETKVKKAPTYRPFRSEVYQVKYEVRVTALSLLCSKVKLVFVSARRTLCWSRAHNGSHHGDIATHAKFAYSTTFWRARDNHVLRAAN